MFMKTPVILIIFNRPNATAKVFAEIAKARPKKLLVISDGPRIDHPRDKEKCQQARRIIEKVDWPCEVLTNYSDKNLGCKMRVATGLDWAFEIVQEAIILEDDCIPHPTFFRFCEELLERYRNNEKVALICGSNLFFSKEKNPYSYYFSVFPQAWGWATWRRFWVDYDVNIKKWPGLRDSNWLENILGDRGVFHNYWKNVFDRTYQQKTGTWDYQLVFTAWIKKAFAIIPSKNLVSNIGFGQNSGTHIKSYHKFSDIKASAMQFPLLHPSDIFQDKKADKFVALFSFTYFRPFIVKVFLYFWLKLKRWIVKK
jgi:hypothetical protein